MGKTVYILRWDPARLLSTLTSGIPPLAEWSDHWLGVQEGWTAPQIAIGAGTSRAPHFIQYFARNWPWYSLRGLHIRITWFSLYGIRIPLFSLYGIHMPLLPYMAIQPIVLGMALLWAAMDSPLWQGPLLWRHNDMTVIVSWNTRGRERDTRQRLDNANAWRSHTVNRSLDSLWDSMRFVTHFWEITPYILRDAIVGWVQSLGKCLGLRPSDTLSLIELVAWLVTSCARGWAILW